MALQKTDAVVLKTQRLGETSKILTLFSRHSGKIKVVAKGARGLKSRFFGNLEPLNHIWILYYYKETRDLHLLSQADIIHPFLELRNDLTKIALGTLFCEMIYRTQLEQPNFALYQALVDALTGIDAAKKDVLNYYYWFMLKFLHISGFQPRFDYCDVCRTRELEGQFRFSIPDGKYYCRNCRAPEPSAVSVSARALWFLRKFQRIPVQEIDKLPDTAPRDCETLLISFLHFHVEETKFLNSLKFLKQI
ncbi:MAG: DNA repair protein RecO [Candidatus Zhuqueibacterota bacterium]